MRRIVIAAVVVAVAGTIPAAIPATAAEHADPRVVAGEPAGFVPTHGNAGQGKTGGASPQLAYHGGPVVSGGTGTVVQPIYWGSSWSTSSEQVRVLQSFYGGVGGSGYLHTNAEYTDAAGHVNTTKVSVTTAIIDHSTSPTRAPQTSAVLAEVASQVSNPVANGYYPVYIDHGRGHTGYCAWHSAGTINGVPVTFGFFFLLSGDSGCDPGSSVTSYSEGVAAAANVSGHELSEMLTDPKLDAWYDSKGAENSDKCAWQFNGLSHFGGFDWQIQGNWSNAAYTARSGYDSLHGCIVSS
jgi:hypothetical protein